MFAFIKSGFTTAQGELDDARVSAFLLVIAYIAHQGYAIHEGQHFDAQAFGIGAGALAAGIGVWFGQRKDN